MGISLHTAETEMGNPLLHELACLACVRSLDRLKGGRGELQRAWRHVPRQTTHLFIALCARSMRRTVWADWASTSPVPWVGLHDQIAQDVIGREKLLPCGQRQLRE